MRLVLTCIILLLVSCSSVEKQQSEKKLSLEKILQLSPGHSDQEKVFSMLGAADFEIPVPDSEEMAWIFKDKKTGYQKLSLVFDSQKRLQSVLWLVSGNESEIKLENSKKRFPNAKFIAQDAPWENPHAAPDERFYSDEAKGISITFRKTRQEVHSIGWYNPNIKPSTDRKPAVKYEL